MRTRWKNRLQLETAPRVDVNLQIVRQWIRAVPEYSLATVHITKCQLSSLSHQGDQGRTLDCQKHSSTKASLGPILSLSMHNTSSWLHDFYDLAHSTAVLKSARYASLP